MKPWKRKPKVVAVGKTCSCCLYGHVGGWLCTECVAFHDLLADLEQRHARHHEESQAIRDLYRDVLDNRPGQE